MVAAAGIAVPLTNETAQASTLAGAAIETNALLVNASRDATPSNLSVVAPREAPPLVVQTPPVDATTKSGNVTYSIDSTVKPGNEASSGLVAVTPPADAAVPAA